MIGSLKERVQILMPDFQADGGGGYEPRYAEYRTVFARVRSQKSQFSKVAGRYTGLRRVQFLLRSVDGLDFDMRVSHRNRTFRLIDIQYADEKRRFQSLIGEEVRP